MYNKFMNSIALIFNIIQNFIKFPFKKSCSKNEGKSQMLKFYTFFKVFNTAVR